MRRCERETAVSCVILSFVFFSFLLVQYANLQGPISIDFTTRQSGAVWCGVLYIHITHILRAQPHFMSQRESVLRCVAVCCSVLWYDAGCLKFTKSLIIRKDHNPKKKS